MSRKKPTIRKNLSAGCTAFIGLLTIATPHVFAQTQINKTAIRVEIAAQPLGDTLISLGKQFGVTIAVDKRLVAGKTAQPLTAKMEIDDAIQHLLANTGLVAIKSAQDTFVISASINENSEVFNTQSSNSDSHFNRSDVERIVVFGTKQDLSLQDTTTSVNIFTNQDIKQQVTFDLNDILLRTPNVSSGSARSLNSLSIRGVSTSGVGLSGTGSTSNIYIDGAPSSRTSNFGASNLWDISQVEVLRGPQSTVQGRNALAGAIIMQSADPEYEFGANMRLLSGNHEQQNYSIALTGPILDDQLAFRLAADYRELDFGVTNVNVNERAQFEEALNVRAKLLFEPIVIDGLRIELGVNHKDSEFGEFASVTGPAITFVNVAVNTDNDSFVITPIDTAFENFDPFGNETSGFFGGRSFNDVETSRVTLDVRYPLNEHWSLTAIGTYEEASRLRDIGNGSLADEEITTSSAELRGEFLYDKLSGWIGAYFFEDSSNVETRITFDPTSLGVPTEPAGSIVSSSILNGGETTNYALFADMTYQVNKKWSINLGARFDHEELAADGQSTRTISVPENCVFVAEIPNFGGLPCTLPFPPSQGATPFDEAFNAFLPRFGVTYNVDEYSSWSFGIQRGYRAGGAFLFIERPESPVTTREFAPEFLTNYEIAFRSFWLDERLRLNVNAFYSDWTDQQVRITNGNAIVFNIETLNAGKSELYGLELNSNYKVSDTFLVFLNVGLQETEFTDFPFASIRGGNGDFVPSNPDFPVFANLAGNRFDSAPRATVSVGFNYLDNSGIFASANAAYTGSQFSDVTNLAINESETFMLVNGRVGYRFDQFEIALFANNLFDERVIISQNLAVVLSDTGIPQAQQAPSFSSTQRRLVGIELRAEF